MDNVTLESRKRRRSLKEKPVRTVANRIGWRANGAKSAWNILGHGVVNVDDNWDQ